MTEYREAHGAVALKKFYINGDENIENTDVTLIYGGMIVFHVNMKWGYSQSVWKLWEVDWSKKLTQLYKCKGKCR